MADSGIVVTDIIARVREQLSDATPEYRWSDPVLLQWLNDVREDVFRRRPDSAYLSDIVVEIPPAITATAETLLFRSLFINAFVFGICAKAMMKDAEHASNQKLSINYMQMYEQAVL